MAADGIDLRSSFAAQLLQQFQAAELPRGRVDEVWRRGYIRAALREAPAGPPPPCVLPPAVLRWVDQGVERTQALHAALTAPARPDCDAALGGLERAVLDVTVRSLLWEADARLGAGETPPPALVLERALTRYYAKAEAPPTHPAHGASATAAAWAQQRHYQVYAGVVRARDLVLCLDFSELLRLIPRQSDPWALREVLRVLQPPEWASLVALCDRAL